MAEAISAFARVPGDEGGRYAYTGTGTGDVNTYALFAEHSLNLTRGSGRSGVIVPTDIAIDATTAPFFGHLVSEARLARLFDFENREKLFADVDSRMKFCLLRRGKHSHPSGRRAPMAEPAKVPAMRSIVGKQAEGPSCQ